MSGIVFHKTCDLATIQRFYTEEIGMKIWLTQAECVILKHGNFLLGFCQRDSYDQDGIITFFYRTREEVERFRGSAKPPAGPRPAERTPLPDDDEEPF